LKYFLTILSSIILQTAIAQPVNNYIQKGNDAYHKGDFTAAIENYKNALRKEPENNTARFNLANALQKQNEIEESKKNYDEVIEKAGNTSIKAESQYNKALAYIKEKDLQNAVDAFKESLKQNPSDDDARENLQKALDELKKRQQQNPQQNKHQQQQNPQKQKKPPPLNKEMMEQKFNELRNQEKQLQKKLQAKTGGGQPEKDW
jgi:Ca-activated chloride channel family protein